MRVHAAAGCLHLVGRVDVANVADVRLALATAIDAGTGDCYVDVSQLDVADATGLGVLVGAHRRAGRAGRRFVLVGVPPRLARLLTMTRLNRIMHTADAVPNATDLTA